MSSSGGSKIALYYNNNTHCYIKDAYLIKNNPNISNFKTVYRKYTNFSKEKIHQPFSTKIGNSDNFATKFTVNINKIGNLLHKMYLEIDVTAQLKNKNNTTYTVNHFINSLIKNYTLKIDNETIDTVTCQWTQMKHELNNNTYNTQVQSSINGGGINTDLNFTTDLNRTEYDKSINECSIPLILGGNYNDELIDAGTSPVTKKYIFEFDFWFTRNIGSALPLFLIDSTPELIIETSSKQEVIGDNINIDSSTFKISDIKFFSEQFHISEDEKNKYSRKNTEYLIDTIQSQSQHTPAFNDGENLNQMNINLNNFNHPVKCLIWGIQNEGTQGSNKGQGPCYFTSMTNNSLYGSDGTNGSATLLLNEKKYFSESTIFFTRINPNKYCNNIPPLDRIGIYSFAINPFSIEPSGILNFSRVSSNKSNKELILTLSNNNLNTIKYQMLYIFAINYNIIKISNGKIALLYI